MELFNSCFKSNFKLKVLSFCVQWISLGFFVCCSADLCVCHFSIECSSTRLVERPVACSTVVWLWLLLHAFQWRPLCTARVSTALIRPLRLRRLSCVWIHLPASGKIGAQVRPPFVRSSATLLFQELARQCKLMINHSFTVTVCIQKGIPQPAEQPQTSFMPPCVLTWSRRRRWKYRPKTVARTKTRTWASSWKNRSRASSQSGRGKVSRGKRNPLQSSSAEDKKL